MAYTPAATVCPRIEEHIVALRDEYPIVVVTHNFGRARRISDDTLVMADGRLVEAGLTARVFEAPQNELARDFVTGRFG